MVTMKWVIGVHNGNNLAAHVKEFLTIYGIANQRCCLTANNAFNNGTMGVCLEAIIPQFPASQNLIGCLAHIINLSACTGFEFVSKNLAGQALLLPDTLGNLVDKT